MMADLFRDALTEPFRGVFDEIVFAVTDWSPDQRFIGPFQRLFGPRVQPIPEPIRPVSGGARTD
jgi:hypothetical protein